MVRCYRAAAVSCALLASLSLLGCGHSSRSLAPAATTAPAQPPAPGAPAATAASADLDYHSAAVLSHNMNASAGNPHYATIHVKPQPAVDFAALAGKGVSSLQGLPGLLPAPSTLNTAHPATTQRSARFAPDDLIKDGAGFDPTLPQAQATAGPSSDPRVTLTTNTDPYQPETNQAAYATYRFALQGYAASGQPQSVGTLWDDNDAPNTYFVGLSDWQNDRWAWFEGSLDNVVTVGDLSPYINSTDNSMLVVVLVLDNQPRDLLLVQVGADEVRGLGGAAPATLDGQDITGPDDYYDGKTVSAVNGAPAVFQLDENMVGPVYDQGQTQSCTCCAAAAMLNYELSRAYAPYWDATRAKERMSPKWNFKETGAGQCWAGRPPETILDFLKNTGGAPEAVAPWNEDCQVDFDEGQCTTWASHLKIASWRKIADSGQEGINAIKNQLFNAHHPVLILITITDDFDSNWDGSQIFHWSGQFPNPLNWHSMLIIGYDESKQAFRVRNSWGEEFGDNGDFWLGYDNFSSKAWIDCFVMSVNHNAATATYFNITQDAAIPPYSVDCSIVNLDKISVAWSPVDLATGYRIYRDTESNLIATISSGTTTTYDDTTVTDHDAHIYYVQTVVGTSKSTSKTSGRGWRAKPAPVPVTINDVRMPVQGKQGDSVKFSRKITNPDGSAATTTWSFPAGAIVEASPVPGDEAVVTLDQAGDYAASVTVTNDAGPVTTDFAFSVLAVPPTPAFTFPAEVERSAVATFDASGSTAVSGHVIAAYLWDFDGDGNCDKLTTNPVLTKVFPKAGSTTIGLAVYDDRGLHSDWTTHTFNVQIPWAHGADPAPFDVGWYNSMAVVNGNPGISYSDANNLKYVGAKDANGGSWNTPVVVDSAGAGQTGFDTSLLVVDGNPAISYWDYTDNKLRYVRASNADGSSWNLPVDVYTNGGLGGQTSLALIDTKPAIAFYDGAQFTVKYVQATDLDGTAWGSLHQVDPATNIGQDGVSLLHVGPAPAIAYSAGGHLKYVRATDADGGTWGTPVVVDDGSGSVNHVGGQCCLWIVDVYPAISYIDSTNFLVKYARASDSDGAAWGAPVTAAIFSSGVTSQGPTTLRVVAGEPAVSFYDLGAKTLCYVQAADADGATWTSPKVLDGGGAANAGAYSNLTVLPSGLPAISYNLASQATLRFIHGQ